MTNILTGCLRSAGRGRGKIGSSSFCGQGQQTRCVRSSGLLAKLINSLFVAPATTIPYAVRETGISYNAAKNNIQKLVELRILTPDMGEDRPQWFFGAEIINTLNANDM